jgi:hypothetical protein
MRTYEQLTDTFVGADPLDIGSRDTLLDVRSGIKALQAKLREFAQEVDQAIIEHIEEHGDIDIGDGTRLYVGTDKSHKCKDHQQTFAAILAATGGDEQAMCEHLSTSAWKPGACSKTLGNERFSDLFETIITKDVKSGSVKRLKTFNPAFGGGA